MGKGTPFVGTEAIDAGTFTERELRRFCTRIYPNVYQRRDSGLTAKDRAVAAWLWSGKRAVVAGNSAAALLGAEWVDPHGAAELISDDKRPPPLIVTRNETLLPGETTQVVGVPVTSPGRTAFDLGRHAGPVSAVIAIDSLAKATALTVDDVEPLIDATAALEVLSSYDKCWVWWMRARNRRRRPRPGSRSSLRDCPNRRYR
jgi:hypothetical protein